MHRALLLALVVLPTFVAAAEPTLPDTPAAHQFAAWLDAFNSGNRDTLRAYFEKNYPARLANLDREISSAG